MCVPVRRDATAEREAIRLTWGSFGRDGGRSRGEGGKGGGGGGEVKDSSAQTMAGLEVSQPGESTSISGETDRKGEGIHLLRGSHSQPRPHILNPSTTPADVQAGEIILVFFIGSAPVAADARVQASIEKEAAVHGDILQEDYIDTYENLTLKSISMIRWVSQNCPNARYVAKIDDDNYVC